MIGNFLSVHGVLRVEAPMLGRTLCAALVTVAAIAVPASAASKDPAARGMDLFLHAPKSVPSGGTWPVQVRVFGFPTVSTLASLAGATLAAAAGPGTPGGKGAVVPKPIAILCAVYGCPRSSTKRTGGATSLYTVAVFRGGVMLGRRRRHSAR